MAGVRARVEASVNRRPPPPLLEAVFDDVTERNRTVVQGATHTETAVNGEHTVVLNSRKRVVRATKFNLRLKLRWQHRL